MKIQSWMKTAGDYACLALAYIEAALNIQNGESYSELSDMDKDSLRISTLWSVYNTPGLLDKDFTVLDADKLLKFLLTEDKSYTVEKAEFTTFPELPFGYCAVRFDNGEFSHWVLCKDKCICYDSLDDSKCRKFGKPTKVRIIKENK